MRSRTALREPEPGDPTVIMCMDEFGPLNLQPHPGRHWAPVAARKGDVAAPRRRRRRATYTRPHGLHLMAGYDLCTDRLYGHVVKKKRRTAFLTFVRYLRSLYPLEVRIAMVRDNFSPHLATKNDRRVSEWAVREQRRACLRADVVVVAEPDRGPVPGAALFRPRRHRPPQSRRASLDDPPLHHLAQPPRTRRRTP